MGTKKRLAEWDQWVAACGFHPAQPTRGGHFRWKHRTNKGLIVVAGGSPSDAHSERNLRALFRKGLAS